MCVPITSRTNGFFRILHEVFVCVCVCVLFALFCFLSTFVPFDLFGTFLSQISVF